MKLIIVLAAAVASFTSCAQVNKSIVKGSAFYTIPTPGTIAVDDSGNPLPVRRNKVYTIVLEVKDGIPEWSKAWIDNKLFTVIPLAVKQSSMAVGKKRADGNEIVMEAAKGNSLLQLELSPQDSYQQPPQSLKQGELLLEGKWKGKPFYYKIPMLTELASPHYQ